MIPSREKKLPGLNYQADGYDEQIAANKVDNSVSARMFGMVGGNYTQVEVMYRGKPSILVLKLDKPSNDPGDIVNAILNFYKYVDLEATSLLKKVVESDKPVSVKVVTEKKPVVKEKGRHGGNNLANADRNLTPVGMEYNTNIYKERVIQILAYANRRSRDENLSEVDRESFTTLDVLRDVFLPIYKDNSPTTVRNKVTSTLRFMAAKQWIVWIGTTKNKTAIYVVGEHPFGNELPAQAEFDESYAKDAKARELEMYREA